MANEVKVESRSYATLLDEATAHQLRLFHTLECLEERGCIIRPTDHGLRARIPSIVPHAPFDRYRVYTAGREAG